MILFGASGHCKVILDILFLNGLKVNYILDDNPKQEKILGINVFKTKKLYEYNGIAIISIGDNYIRKKVSEKYKFEYIFAIHPKAVISKYSKIGEGTVVMANVCVNPDVNIGKHCILNTGCVIEHDCSIEDFAHISPNVAIAGNVQVGEGSHIGIGSSIIQGIKIGKWCTIGAGAVIIRDVPDFATVVGNPGKIIKLNEKKI